MLTFNNILAILQIKICFWSYDKYFFRIMKGFKAVPIFSLFVCKAHFSISVNIFKNYLNRKPFYMLVLEDNKTQTFAWDVQDKC